MVSSKRDSMTQSWRYSECVQGTHKQHLEWKELVKVKEVVKLIRELAWDQLVKNLSRKN